MPSVMQLVTANNDRGLTPHSSRHAGRTQKNTTDAEKRAADFNVRAPRCHTSVISLCGYSKPASHLLLNGIFFLTLCYILS